MGRPTECTPEKKQKIAQAIRLGLTYERAAQAAGVTYQAMRNWITRAEAEQQRLADNPKARPRQGEQPYIDFFEALSAAEAEGELLCAAKVYEAAKGGDWRAAAWILERRHPARWGANAELAAQLERIQELIRERLADADSTRNQKPDSSD